MLMLHPGQAYISSPDLWVPRNFA